MEKKEDLSEERVRKAIAEAQGMNNKKAYILGGMFLVALLGFVMILYLFPTLSDEEKSRLFVWPRSGEDLNNIYLVVARYIESHYFTVMFAFCYLYIFLQAFAIPGPIILSLISGALFGGYLGFFLVCFCATTGASLCYGMSAILGRFIILKLVPSVIVELNKRFQNYKDNLIYYMLFLRITPLVPNWLINVACPIIGVPYYIFGLGTFFGLMPGNIIHIKTGMVLRDIQSLGFNWQNFLILFFLSFLALLPTLFKKQLKKLEQFITYKHFILLQYIFYQLYILIVGMYVRFFLQRFCQNILQMYVVNFYQDVKILGARKIF